ncbi:MAG TPA: hypothetical protein VFR44_07965 [Actinomycetota bacterium]|nr:hypothetical protein [Actinomycetota bacterium]
METAIGVLLLVLVALGYRRAISAVEHTWGVRWGRWAWWTSIPLWAGAAVVAGLIGGPGWTAFVLVAGGIFAVAVLTQRGLRGSR